MESIFIEIDKIIFMTNSNIIIAVTCRMVNLIVEMFDKCTYP